MAMALKVRRRAPQGKGHGTSAGVLRAFRAAVNPRSIPVGDSLDRRARHLQVYPFFYPSRTNLVAQQD
jgi:hypothetical protein